MGITGASGGGLASTRAILQFPDFFKVAVSFCGNHDNRGYNAGWVRSRTICVSVWRVVGTVVGSVWRCLWLKLGVLLSGTGRDLPRPAREVRRRR